MKNYTYEQFLQLYDYANEKVREQIQKNCYRFFMTWPEEKWKATSHACLFKLRVNGVIRTYQIPVAFIMNSARSYARDKCSDVEEKQFFARYREFSEKVMHRDVQRLQDVFQEYLHLDTNPTNLATLDMYVKQFATREEVALYENAKESRKNQRLALELQRRQERFRDGQKSFEIAIQYGFDSPEFLALPEEFGLSMATVRSRILEYLKSDLLSSEEKAEVTAKYKKAIQQMKKKSNSFSKDDDSQELEKITQDVSQFIQSDLHNPSAELQNEAQILFERNPVLYEQYYQKVTGDKVPLYSGIRSVMADAKESIQNHSTFTPRFALRCIFELGQPINEVLPIAQSLLSSTDFNYFKSISNYYTRLTKNQTNGFIPTMDDFMAQQIEVHCKKDQNGMPIAGTGEQVTLEHKREVVQLMEAYHIPFCSAIYNAALRLYMNGNLMVSSKTEDNKVSSPVKVLRMKGDC